MAIYHIYQLYYNILLGIVFAFCQIIGHPINMLAIEVIANESIHGAERLYYMPTKWKAS